jgi:segregation and condensation protein A
MSEAENNVTTIQADNASYRISLDHFEGPLDLLLHLIKKNDIDIYDIPIALVLEQYLQYVELAKELNIDLAGDFLLTAAELILIKSRLLLPADETGEEEGPDPRDELVRRLLEYQRYKQAGKQLIQRPLLGRDVFKRGSAEEEPHDEEGELDADMTSLLLAFQAVLKRLPRQQAYEIEGERTSVADKILQLTERLRDVGEMKFQELFDLEKGRADVVVTFLALLEMAKMHILQIRQGTSFDEIFIASRIEAVPESKESKTHEL